MAGKTLKDLGFTEEIRRDYWAVKESVLSVQPFPWAGYFAFAGDAFRRAR